MKFLPVPIMIGILAAIWMILSAQFNLLPWVAFITWGGYFLAGISSRSAIREAISFTVGVLFGAVIVMMATAFGAVLGTMAVPVAVGIAGFTIVLLELVPWFDMAPGYFLGAAAFFAAGAKADISTIWTVLVPGLLGLALGILSAYLRGMIFKYEKQKDPLVANK